MLRRLKPILERLSSTDEERFWNYVDRDPNSCWKWCRARMQRGYGIFTIRGPYDDKFSNFLAHRVAFALTYGEPGPGLDICHICDNPACVRPSHLFQGTRRDNMQDAIKKGRHRPNLSNYKRGSSIKWAKLAEADIPLIRARVKAGESRRRIAADYGVSDGAIDAIVWRKNWAHVQ